MYLLYCSLSFLLFSIPKKHRYEWLVLASLAFLTWFNKEIFDHSGLTLYYVRAMLTFIAAYLLVLRLTLLGFYQACILLLTLIVYMILAFYVAENTIYIIRDSYKATVYVLVKCQFIGFISTIWCCYHDYITNNDAFSKYLQGTERT